MQQPRCDETSLPGAAWLRSFRKRLIAWFRQHGRETLPWRGQRDPYAVWVSEIMLQQTTTQTVRSYYTRFLERFPTLAALAESELPEVNRYWEGLGYYRRASQMHATARRIMAEYGGRFPEDEAVLRSFPGIGRYTAGAILSITKDQRLPILEANTLRLHARLLAYPENPSAGAGQRLLWEMAEMVLPEHEAGLFNQALMDLGSLVCTPESPHCVECPVVMLCRTAQQGLQTAIPFRKTKCPAEARVELGVIICKGEKILLQQALPGERWAGLWGLPRVDVSELFLREAPGRRTELNGAQRAMSIEAFRQHCGLDVRLEEQLLCHRHTVTKYRITLIIHRAAMLGIRVASKKVHLDWFDREQIQLLAINAPARKVLNTIVST